MLSMLAHTEFGASQSSNGAAKTAAEEVFVLPSTVGQQGFWYLDQLEPGNAAYNIAVRFRLQGELRLDALERAIQDIVARHESLRTAFAVQDGVPVQVIVPRLTIPLPIDELREVAETERRGQADAFAGEEARRRFDLANGPLIRVRLQRLGDAEHMLLVTIHHIVADGWSIGILTNELGAHYEAHCRGVTPTLPELSVQCGDFAIWQEEWLGSQDLKSKVDYWSRQLAKLPLLEIPTDRPRAAKQAFRGSIESILLPRALTYELEALSQRERVTTFMVMLAGFKLLLRQYTGLEDVYVGSVFAGRPRVELEHLIGMFINPLVLRTDLSGDPEFPQLLTRVRDTVMDAFANQELPFERVVEAVQPRRDPTRHPVFQINFLFQRDFVQPFEAAGVTLTAIPSVSPGAIYDLNFFMVERADGWRASCEFNTDLYQLDSVRQMLGNFRSVLERIAANPGGRVSDLAIKLARPNQSSPQPAAIPAESIDQSLMPSEASRGSYIKPRNETEARLTELWERVLNVPGISVNADFFDLGGHSLLAARLLSQVQKVFGVGMSLATLLQAPTIEDLAARIIAEKNSAADALRLRDGEWEHPEDQVFPLRREGALPPLVLIDAGPMYRPLVRKLGNDQPVWGVALPRLSDLPKPFTVKDIAANLVEALCASPVKGSYCLAGWSTAGVIAYEMAQQLKARGKEVLVLILFDTNSPAYMRKYHGLSKLPVRIFFFFEKLFYHRRRLHHMSLVNVWRHFRERTKKFDLQAPALPVDIENRPEEEVSDELFRYSWQVQYLAAVEYTPEACEEPVVLFRSEAFQSGWFRDPQLGWGKVAEGGLHMFEMPGEHDHMFLEPDVQRLADSLKRCLKRARPMEAFPPIESLRLVRTA
jgi:thioesterase domain-containing protein/acyl carrier protein